MHLRRAIPLLIALMANGMFSLLLMEINHSLAPWSLHLLLPAVFVLYPALNLSYRAGLTACLLTGLLQDAALPLSPHGFFTLALPTLHLIIHRLRHKLHREGGLDSVLLAQLLNLATLLVLTAMLSPAQPGGLPAHLPALLFQILLAQVLLFLVGSYFLDIQRRLGKLFLNKPREEEAPAT
tara:strand:+ start:348 stop:890 length:543 start_codon:yes stop_codon:yes gene_type:complete